MPIKMKRTQHTTHLTIIGHPPEISSSETRSPENSDFPDRRLYECKTCHKKFDSFQALGGHQGIHKKLILNEDVCLLSLQIAAAPKLHQCKVCMKKFPTGQALGGHMRRHKELLQRQQAAGEVVDSNFTSAAAAEPQWLEGEAQEDQRQTLKRELVLAAKELRLSI